MKKLFIISLLVISGFLNAQEQQHPFSAMPFRFIGPDGNRAIAVVGEPGNPMVSYVGAASGGIFKTTDGGVHWRPIFDQMDNSSIGALAIAASNPKHIWAGTGETFVIRPAHANGNGVYKSTDGCKTWKNKGLKEQACLPNDVRGRRQGIEFSSPDAQTTRQPGSSCVEVEGTIVFLEPYPCAYSVKRSPSTMFCWCQRTLKFFPKTRPWRRN